MLTNVTLNEHQGKPLAVATTSQSAEQCTAHLTNCRCLWLPNAQCAPLPGRMCTPSSKGADGWPSLETFIFPSSEQWWSWWDAISPWVPGKASLWLWGCSTAHPKSLRRCSVKGHVQYQEQFVELNRYLVWMPILLGLPFILYQAWKQPWRGNCWVLR